MNSPFPGMDPYLEAYWPDVHSRLITYTSDAIQALLPGDLQARIEDQVYIEDPLGPDRHVSPDVLVVERKDWRPGAAAENGGGVAVSEPVVVAMPRRQRHLRSIAITDPRSGGRLVTSIELLSPSNKLPGKGQEMYIRKRREMIEGEVNIIEIDLTRAGERVLLVPTPLIPVEARTTYQVCVWRSCRPEAVEVHRVPLRGRLPIIPIPLRESDDDVLLELQPLIDLAYRNGRYANLDYRPEADPPLDPDDASWADALLRERGLR